MSIKFQRLYFAIGIICVITANLINHWWIDIISEQIVATNNTLKLKNKQIESSWRQYEKKEQAAIALLLANKPLTDDIAKNYINFFDLHISGINHGQILNYLAQERSNMLDEINNNYLGIIEQENQGIYLNKTKRKVQDFSLLLSSLGFILVLIFSESSKRNLN